MRVASKRRTQGAAEAAARLQVGRFPPNLVRSVARTAVGQRSDRIILGHNESRVLRPIPMADQGSRQARRRRLDRTNLQPARRRRTAARRVPRARGRRGRRAPHGITLARTPQGGLKRNHGNARPQHIVTQRGDHAEVVRDVVSQRNQRHTHRPLRRVARGSDSLSGALPSVT